LYNYALRDGGVGRTSPDSSLPTSIEAWTAAGWSTTCGGESRADHEACLNNPKVMAAGKPPMDYLETRLVRLD